MARISTQRQLPPFLLPRAAAALLPRHQPRPRCHPRPATSKPLPKTPSRSSAAPPEHDAATSSPDASACSTSPCPRLHRAPSPRTAAVEPRHQQSGDADRSAPRARDAARPRQRLRRAPSSTTASMAPLHVVLAPKLYHAAEAHDAVLVPRHPRARAPSSSSRTTVVTATPTATPVYTTPTSPKPLAACSPWSPPWQQRGNHDVAAVTKHLDPVRRPRLRPRL